MLRQSFGGFIESGRPPTAESLAAFAGWRGAWRPLG
jgi:hypothetical protein